MARIEHLAIWTDDLQRLVDFYSSYFDATPGPAYVNAAKGFESRFLTFEDGARIEIMHSSTLPLTRSARGTERLGLAHIALSVGSRLRVDALTERLRKVGFDIVGAPRHTGDGYYESVVLDPDGNRIEITV